MAREMELIIVPATTDDSKTAASVSFLPPACVTDLTDKDISAITCWGDHSLAVSAKSGSVYAWGYGNGGRLGFGEDGMVVPSYVMWMGVLT